MNQTELEPEPLNLRRAGRAWAGRLAPARGEGKHQSPARLQKGHQLSEGARRSEGDTCIQTALIQTRSNSRPRRCTASRPGRRAEPADRRLRMPLLAFASHTLRGLDRHDVPATAGEPAGIAARAGTDVEDEARPFGTRSSTSRVAVLKRQALVKLRELAGLSVVGCYGIAHGQQGATLDLHPARLASNDQQ